MDGRARLLPSTAFSGLVGAFVFGRLASRRRRICRF
jgi:hypothetical protein